MKLSEKTKDALDEIRSKIEKNDHKWTSEELVKLGAVYQEVVSFAGKKVPAKLDSSCQDCIGAAVGIVNNYISYHEVQAGGESIFEKDHGSKAVKSERAKANQPEEVARMGNRAETIERFIEDMKDVKPRVILSSGEATVSNMEIGDVLLKGDEALVFMDTFNPKGQTPDAQPPKSMFGAQTPEQIDESYTFAELWPLAQEKGWKGARPSKKKLIEFLTK